MLYSLAIDILLIVLPKNIIVSIETPWNCWMWSALVALARQNSDLACKLYNQVVFVQFHACCHGSTRRKNTGWLSSVGVFSSCRHSVKTITCMHLGGLTGKMGGGHLIRRQKLHTPPYLHSVLQLARQRQRSKEDIP